MKKIILLITFLGYVNFSHCQELKLAPKFLTFHNARISLGLGYAISIANDNKGALYEFMGKKPSSSKIIFPKTDTTSGTPYMSFSLPIDLYAPNSFLGFYTEISYSLYRWNLKDTSLIVPLEDSYKFNVIEIPFYLKLRPGSVANTRSHLWFLLGGSYSIPVKVSRTSNYTASDSNIKMFSSYYSVGGEIGYELFLNNQKSGSVQKYLSDQYRVVLFLRANYSIKNKLNSNWAKINVAHTA
jgi:hypothetical protein